MIKAAVARACIALLPFFGAAVCASSSAHAAEAAWVMNERSSIRVVAWGPSPDEPDAIVLGIHLRLQPGWETYWRTPGDAGVPPDFFFDETENVDELYVDWPLPERKVQAGMTTYVYKDEVLLPVTIYPHEATQPVKFRMRVTYAACREVCTLEEADLALDVMPSAKDAKLTPLFEKNKARMPILENTPELAIDRVNGTDADGKRRLEVVARSNTAFVNPQIIIEAAPGFAFKPATVAATMEGRRLVLRSEYTHPNNLAIGEGETVVVTVFDATHAIERIMLVYPPE